MDLTGKAQILTLILNEHQSNKCIKIAKDHGVYGGIATIGKGTVKNTILNLLGIKNEKKEIVKFLLANDQAQDMLDLFKKELLLDKPGQGIAFTTPISSIMGHTGQAVEKLDDSEQNMEVKTMFKKINMIVDRGMSDEVMDIARQAGVRGGTILHGRGAGAEIATSLFGVEIEPEKELVIMLTPEELVDKVIKALAEGLSLDEPGKGILYVEPILDTRGLVEMSDKVK